MKTIYLDQNAASELAVAPPGSKWRDIRSMFARGHYERKIICPIPMETLIESAKCRHDKRIAINTLFQELSDDMAFKDLAEMLIESTVALARGNPRPFPFARMSKQWSNNGTVAALVAASHDRTRECMTLRQRALMIPEDRKYMSREEIFKAVTMARCGMFWRDLKKFLTNSSAPLNIYEIPWLMEGLQRCGITPGEASVLCELVRHHEWEIIPENYVDLRLGSRWEYEQLQGYKKSYKANDEFDRWRASVALLNAQLFITDGYTAGLCADITTLGVSETVVYSVKQLDEISDWTNKILSN